MMEVRVTVHRNERYLTRMCAVDGSWLVTTHNRRVVKLQAVDGVPETGENEGMVLETLDPPQEHRPRLFRTTVHRSDQTHHLETLFSDNAQWLVRTWNGGIQSVSKVEPPLVLADPAVAEPNADVKPEAADPGPQAEPEEAAESSAKRPTRRRKANTTP